MTEEKPGDNTIEETVKDYSNKAAKGFMWLASTTAVWQVISWVFTILTARILDPTDYGIFALAETVLPYMLLVSVFNIPQWYIQEKHVDENADRTFLTWTLSLGSVMTVIGIFSAPYIANFYNNQDLVLPFQVLCSIFLIHGYYLLPLAQLRREMRFKPLAIINFWSGTSRVILVYILAVLDFGFWALVIGAIYVEVFMVISLTVLKGLPAGFGWDNEIAKKIWKFGLAATGANVLYIIFSTADDVLIGKFLGTEILGYYFMAFYLMDMPLAKFNNLARPVLLSYLSKIRSYDEKLKSIFLDISKAALWLIFPVLVGMALVAYELVPVVFGEKWTPMVIPLIFLCIAGLFRAFTDHIPSLFFALGKPQMSFKINVVTAILLPLAFFVGVSYNGLDGILWAWVLAYPIVCFMILRGLSKLTIITEWMYVKNLKIPVICTILMALAVTIVHVTLQNMVSDYILLGAKILSGVIVYASISYILFKDEIFKALKLLRS